jgi:hypothetical protein
MTGYCQGPEDPPDPSKSLSRQIYEYFQNGNTWIFHNWRNCINEVGLIQDRTWYFGVEA